MKQRILLILAGLGLAIGLVAGAPPASAHSDHPVTVGHVTAPTHLYDDLAAWTCGATRPASNWNVVHAVPDYLTSTHVEEWCEATLVNHLPIQWYAVYEFSPPNIYRASQYNTCGFFGCPEP